MEYNDELHEKLQEFSVDFAKLVRKYCPKYDPEYVTLLQERTSCFNPYVWSEEFDIKEN